MLISLLEFFLESLFICCIFYASKGIFHDYINKSLWKIVFELILPTYLIKSMKKMMKYACSHFSKNIILPKIKEKMEKKFIVLFILKT